MSTPKLVTSQRLNMHMRGTAAKTSVFYCEDCSGSVPMGFTVKVTVLTPVWLACVLDAYCKRVDSEDRQHCVVKDDSHTKLRVGSKLEARCHSLALSTTWTRLKSFSMTMTRQPHSSLYLKTTLGDCPSHRTDGSYSLCLQFAEHMACSLQLPEAHL